MRREFGWPLAELGNIRLRKGDLDGAEEAFLAAHEHVWCPHPGLALVRLAQGRVAEASTLIDDAIAHPFQTPSKERPPFGDLTLAPLFEAQVEIAVAAGDRDTARRASESLRAIANSYHSPWLVASAALAEARTALLGGDLDHAVTATTAAISGWADVGAPYETAVARMVLAEAHARSGSHATARMERQAAATAFHAFGAELRAAQMRALLDGGPPPDHSAEHDRATEPAGFAATVRPVPSRSPARPPSSETSRASATSPACWPSPGVSSMSSTSSQSSTARCPSTPQRPPPSRWPRDSVVAAC